jgi:hypothetical protein
MNDLFLCLGVRQLFVFAQASLTVDAHFEVCFVVDALLIVGTLAPRFDPAQSSVFQREAVESASLNSHN